MLSQEAILLRAKSALCEYGRSFPGRFYEHFDQDVKILSAKLYHVYLCKVEATIVDREFTLKKGGVLVPRPMPIIGYDVWHMDKFSKVGDYELPILETCFDQECADCGGSGKIACTSCGSKGKKACPMCHGEKIYECRVCRGKTKVTCQVCHGKGMADCPNCKGRGKSRCEVCDGGGYVERARYVNCSRCHGTGVRPSPGGKYEWSCNVCDGKGQVKEYYKDFCPSCRGIGRLTCSHCNGTGQTRCSSCQATGIIKCATCKGEGRVHCNTCNERGVIACGDCHGHGYNQCEVCAGKGHYPRTYHLKQVIVSVNEEKRWTDSGLPESRVPNDLAGYPCEVLHASESNSELVDQHCNPSKVCPECMPLEHLWTKYIKPYANESRYHFKKQRIEYRRYESSVAVEYEYDGRQYRIWVDLSSGLITADGLSQYEEYRVEAEKVREANETAVREHFEHETLRCLRRARLFRALLMPQYAIGAWQKAMMNSGNEKIAERVVSLVKRMSAWVYLGAAASLYWFWRPVFDILPNADVLYCSYTGLCALCVVLWIAALRRDLCLRVVGGCIGMVLMGGLVAWSFLPRDYFVYVGSQYYVLGGYAAYALILMLVVCKRHRCRDRNVWPMEYKNGSVSSVLLCIRKHAPSVVHSAVMVVLIGVSYVAWYFFAGPGVPMSRRLEVASELVASKDTVEQGVRALTEIARTGHIPSMVAVAKFRMNGDAGATIIPGEAFRMSEMAMRANDPEGVFLLGQCYQRGMGVEVDYTEAFKLYEKSVGLGYGDAGNHCDSIRALAMCWRRAHEGNADAQYELSQCYAKGLGIGINKDEAGTWLRKAAEGGSRAGCVAMSARLREGERGRENILNSYKYAKRAAEKGDTSALKDLGAFFLSETDIQDYSNALVCYKDAAQANDAEAAIVADEIKVIGGAWDAAGEGVATSQYVVACCFLRGIGVPVDKVKARDWLMKSASGGCHDAEYCLAELCLDNEGLRVREVDPIALLQDAAATGHVGAMIRLGRCLYSGIGVRKDVPRALDLWERADEAGSAEAAFLRGRHYYDGRGLLGNGKDLDSALPLLESAAKRGSVDAMMLLGRHYMSGSGLFGSGKNPEKAFHYYRMAAQAGSIEAAKMLENNR